MYSVTRLVYTEYGSRLVNVCRLLKSEWKLNPQIHTYPKGESLYLINVCFFLREMDFPLLKSIVYNVYFYQKTVHSTPSKTNLQEHNLFTFAHDQQPYLYEGY